MKTVKGVVMRVEKKSVTVYTSEGDFLEIPPPKIKPEVGQVIPVRIKPGRRPLITYAVAAAVMILALALGMFGSFAGPGAAVAYVALDINPSIELFVNKDAKVIKTRALNEQAEAILSSGGVEGTDIYRAVDLIVKDAYAKGYIKAEDKNLILAGVIPLKESAAALVDETKLRDTIYYDMKEQQVPGFVVVNKAWEEAEKEAEKLGLSLNKYLVYDRMSREGIPVTPEDFRSSSIRQVVEQSGVRISSLFPEESCEVGGDEPGYSRPVPVNGNGEEPRAGASGSGGQTGAHHGYGSQGDPGHGAGGAAPNPEGNAGTTPAGLSGTTATPRDGDGEHPWGAPDADRQPGASPEGEHDEGQNTGKWQSQEWQYRPQTGGGNTTRKDVYGEHTGERGFSEME